MRIKKVGIVLSFTVVMGGSRVGWTKWIVKEESPRLILQREVSTLIFSKKTCNLEEIKILDISLGKVFSPALKYIDKYGKVFDQNRATNGTLSLKETEDWLIVRGEFNPSSEGGIQGARVRVEYRIRKEDGFTLVSYRLNSESSSIRKLWVELAISNLKENKMNMLQLGNGIPKNPQEVWIPWRHLEVLPEKNKVYVKGELINLVLFSNGKIGFVTEPLDFAGLLVKKEYEGYISVETRDQKHLIRYTFINQPPGSEVWLREPYSLRFAMATLPYRIYKTPQMLFYAGGGTPIEEMAKVGVDAYEHYGLGYYPFDSKRARDYKEVTQKLHKYGIRHMFFIVPWLGVTGWAKAYGTAKNPDWEAIKRDQLKVRGEWVYWNREEKRPIMCLNAPSFRKLYQETAKHAIEDLGVDGIRVDCTTPAFCQNEKHGDSPNYSLETSGYSEFFFWLKKFVEKKKRETGRKIYIIPTKPWHPSVNSLADVVMVGEGQNEYPDKVQRELEFNALLYGYDFFYLAGGGNTPVRIDTPRLYTHALAKCGTVIYTREMKIPQIFYWQKYMNPLKIFGVKKSTVHHPYHPEFERFIKGKWNRDTITPVLYSSFSRHLLVVGNEGEREEKVEIDLSLSNLEIPPRKILVYEVFSSTIKFFDYPMDETLRLKLIIPPFDSKFYLILPEPAHPALLWHDVRTWEVNPWWEKIQNPLTLSTVPQLNLDLRGVPETESILELYSPNFEGAKVVEGLGRIYSYQQKDKIFRLKVKFNEEGRAKVVVRFSKLSYLKKELEEDRLDNIFKKVESIFSKIWNRNFYTRDLEELKRVIPSLINLAHRASTERLRKRMLEKINDAQRLVYINTSLPRIIKERKQIINRIREKNLMEGEWMYIGPFGTGFDTPYPPEKKLEFGKGYVGKRGRKIRWNKAVGYYLDFGRLVEEPTLTSVAEPRRDMIAYAWTQMESPVRQKAQFKFEGEGGIKIWLNGKLIAIERTRGLNTKIKSRWIEVLLKKGKNELFLKTESGGEKWYLYLYVKPKLTSPFKLKMSVPFKGSVKYAHDWYLNAKEIMDKIRGKDEAKLLAVWHFEEEGEIAKDDSGNGNHGWIKGARRVKGIKGKALYFDGDDLLKVGDKFNHVYQGTLEMWVKAEGGFKLYQGSEFLFEKRLDELNFHALYLDTNTGLNYLIYKGGIGHGARQRYGGLDDRWHYIVSTFGKGVKLYLDGVLQEIEDSTNLSLVDIGEGSEVILGRNFKGLIDEVYLWDKVLSPGEIKERYKNYLKNFCTSN